MRGRSIQNPQPFQMRSPQRAVSPLIQVIPQGPQQQIQQDGLINLKMEKVLMGFEIQRLNCVLLELDKKRNAMKNNMQQIQEREQVLLLEIQSQKQEIQDLKTKEKNSREKLNSYLRAANQQENQLRDQILRSEEFKKLQEENKLLESKITYLLNLNQAVQDNSSAHKEVSKFTNNNNDQLPEQIQLALSNLQNNIQQYRNGNMIQNKYANALTMLSELITSHNALLQKIDKTDDHEVELQQIQIYLTSLNQDVEALKRYETPKAVRRILNNQSPLQFRSQSPTMKSDEVFSKIITHIEHLQLDAHNIPTIIKQISLLNSLVRLKNEDLKLIGNNQKQRSSPVRYSVERSNSSIRVLTPIKYVSPIRVSPARFHTHLTTVSVPQRVSIIHPGVSDSIQNQQRIAESFPQQSRDEFQNALSQFRDNQEKINQLEYERQNYIEQIQFWKQKYEEEIDKKQQGLAPESAESQLLNQIKQNQESLSEIQVLKQELMKMQYQLDQEQKKQYEDSLKAIENTAQAEKNIRQLRSQIDELEEQNEEKQKKIQDLLNKLQCDDEGMSKQKPKVPQQPEEEEDAVKPIFTLCEPMLIEKRKYKHNSSQTDETSDLKAKNLELQDQIIQLQDQLNSMSSPLRQTDPQQKPSQKQLSDPEKLLKISQLEQENQKLKTQIQQLDQQRQDDLQNFEQMLGGGVQEKNVVALMNEKQDLQRKIRDQENQIDNLQQKLIGVQSDLQQSQKSLIDKDNQEKAIQQEGQNQQGDDKQEIQKLQDQIQKLKGQYQELLETCQQNLTPNSLKEKVIQQQKQLHDQDDKLQELYSQIQNEIPQLKGKLAEAQQQLEATNKNNELQEQRYQDLVNKKLDPPAVQNEQAVQDLKNQNDQKVQEIQQLQDQVNTLSQDLAEKEKINDQVESLQKEKDLAEQLQKILQDQIKDQLQQLEDMKQKDENQRQELLNLKNQIQESNPDFWKQEYEKLKEQQPQQQQEEDDQLQEPQSQVIEAQNEEISNLKLDNQIKDKQLEDLEAIKAENDDLRKNKMDLQNQLLEKNKQLNEIQQVKPQQQQADLTPIQFQTDPQKNLQISQLQSECQALKNQLQKADQQRKDDLEDFKKMIGNGVNEQNVVKLMEEKQKLQNEARQLENQIIQLQQEQLATQNQVADKNKQIQQLIESQPAIEQQSGQPNVEKQNLSQQELINENTLLEKQLQKLKEQYQQLLEQSQQNLTPNSLKEQLLQKTNLIHQQEEQIDQLQHKIETELPQTIGQLEQANQNLQTQQEELDLWKQKYTDLLNNKQDLPKQDITNEDIKKLNLEEAQQTIANLLDQLQKIQAQEKSQEELLQMQEFQLNQTKDSCLNLEREIELAAEQKSIQEDQIQSLKNQIQELMQKDLENREEILKLKNQLAEENAEFWKDEYQKLAKKHGEDIPVPIPSQKQIVPQAQGAQGKDEGNEEQLIQNLKQQNQVLQDKLNEQNLLDQQVDQLKAEKLNLQNELIQAKKQIQDLFADQVPKQFESQGSIQFQTDPQKVLQLSQLQQQNQALKQQINQIEQQRKEDLQKFQDMIGNGVNEQQVVALMSEKQQLQSDLRALQNQLDQLQQEQLGLQSQLTQKTKQLIDVHDDTKQDEAKQVQQQLQNDNELLKKQLEKAKDQYQELLDLQAQNLTPNGLKEKLLQQTKQIHDLEDQVHALQHQIETEIPQLTGELSETKQKLKDAVTDAQLWNEKYHDLFDHKQNLQPELQKEDIANMTKEEAQDAVHDLQQKNQNLQVSQKQISDTNQELQLKIQNLQDENDNLKRYCNQLQEQKDIADQQVEVQNQQLRDLQAKDKENREEILQLKNKLVEENADFWKNEYQKLADKHGEDMPVQVPSQKQVIPQIKQQDDGNQTEELEQLKQQNDMLQDQIKEQAALESQTDQLKAEKLNLQNELIQAKKQIQDLLADQVPKQFESQGSIQFQTDPQKVLQISQLQQQNQALKQQIDQVEQQRSEDLQKFQDMIGDGVNEQQVVALMSEKQQLQSDLRALQNQLDQLQQEQLGLQSQLTQKTKQLIDVHDDTKQDEAKQVQQQLQNDNELLKKQLEKAKDQYQELLDLQAQNLTPNGLKEKLLQQTKQIHDLEDQVHALQHQIETEIPQLTGELSETKQKLKDAVTDAQLWNEKYHDLFDHKQNLQPELQKEDIANMTKEEAQDAVHALQEQNQKLQLQLKQYQNQNVDLAQKLTSLQDQNDNLASTANQLQELSQIQEQQIEALKQQDNELRQKDNQNREEIVNLKNKLVEENADFWKNEYQKLADKHGEDMPVQVPSQKQVIPQIKQQDDGNQTEELEQLKQQNDMLQDQIKEQAALESQTDQLKAEKLNLQNELIQAKKQIQDLLADQVPKQFESQGSIQFQTDPQKVLQISQLQQQNQALKQQIDQVEQQRREDLQKFQDMIGDGVNEQQVVALMSEKQQLQSDLRALQNQLDQLQQEQLGLQSQLTQKTKQLIDVHDDTKQDEAKQVQQQLQNDNELLKKQLEKAKDQYQELLDLQAQNLTPNGLKEKLLQQTKQIHDLEDQVHALQHQIETEIPQLTGELSETKQKLKDAVTDAQLWNEKYHDLFDHKQSIQPELQKEDIANMTKEEAQDAVHDLQQKNQNLQVKQKQLEDKISDLQNQQLVQQEQTETLNNNLNQTDQLNGVLQKQIDSLQQQNQDLQKQANLNREEVLQLKNQLDEQNGDFWKNEYQKLAEKHGQDMPVQVPSQKQVIPQNVKVEEGNQTEQIENLMKENYMLQEQIQNNKDLQDQLDKLQKNKLDLQQELIDVKGQLQNALADQVPKQFESQGSIQFQTDPQKVLQINQLQQQNQALKQQIDQVEQQRSEDLQKFQDMIGNGVNEQQVVALMSEKQQLQSDLRALQNQLDQLQQEQLGLQSQLTQKTKQLIDVHDDTKQDEAKQVQQQLQNDNELLKKQLEKAKDQYQELLDLQAQNLTPNGLKEKLLQQTKQIHDLEDQVHALQHQIETEIPQLTGELSETKQKLKDAVTDAQLWNEKYQQLLSDHSNLPVETIKNLQDEVEKSKQEAQQQKQNYNQLLQEQIQQLSPSSSQAKLLQAMDEINKLKEKLANQGQEIQKQNEQFQIPKEQHEQLEQLREELDAYQKQIEMQDKLSEIANQQIDYLKSQLQLRDQKNKQQKEQEEEAPQDLEFLQSQNIILQAQLASKQKDLQELQDQIAAQQQQMEELQNEGQKAQFWKQQYTDLMSKQAIPEKQQQQILQQKEQALEQQIQKPESEDIQVNDLQVQIQKLQEEKIQLQQQLIESQSKLNQASAKLQSTNQPVSQEVEKLQDQNQGLQKLNEELKKQNQNVLEQMNQALSGDPDQKQLADLIQQNQNLSLVNAKLMIDLEQNQKELLRQSGQISNLHEKVNELQDPTISESAKMRVSDLQKQIDLTGQQVDFWKQKYQQVLNDFSQQLSPTSVQRKIVEQAQQLHQQEEALLMLQQTTDQVKQENENQINQLKLENKITQDENANMKKRILDLQNEKLNIQDAYEKQIQSWKDKYEEALLQIHNDPQKVQEIIQEHEDNFANQNQANNTQSILKQQDASSDLIEKLRSQNQTFQGEVTFYKQRVLELEQQQQKIEPKEQDTIQSQQYQISQLEKDLSKALSNQAYWESKYNDVVQQNINKEVGSRGDAQNTVSYWRQKYDQAEQNRQQLIAALAEKDEQLEQHMQSFQSILKDELKEELTKIRTQERQKIELQLQQSQPANEQGLVQKLKEQHEIEKQQLIKEFLRRIDQLLQSNVQKYPEGENWKELVLRYEKQRQNELYELRQHIEILQRSQITTRDIEFYAERRAYENTINELRNRVQLDDPQELYDTIEYQRRQILDMEDQIAFLQNERTNLEMHAMQLNQQLDQLKDRLLRYQQQSDTRKRQRAEVLDAIEEMKSQRAGERESYKSPYRQMRQSQNRASWDRYPKDYQRPTNLQGTSQFQTHNSPMHRIPFQQSQFISPQQENRDIALKLQELDEVKHKYQSALNNILQLEAQVIEKLQQDDIQIE